MKKPNLLHKRSPETPVAEDTGGDRVTNDTVSHHREEILSKGRQFKYPFHRSKHRIAVISVALVVVAVLFLSVFMGLELYRWQSTSEFTTNVTKIFPFPVARVNGSFTLYESYLFELNSSLHWQQKYGTTDLHSPDGKREIDYLKRSALNKAMTNTIAHKMAREHKISVSDSQVDAIVVQIKAGGGNLKQILGEQFDFTESDLRRYIRDSLLRQKVSQVLDAAAPKRAAAILKQIRGGKSFSQAASDSSEDLETKQLGGDIGVVEKGHANLPTEVADTLFTLKQGEVSNVIKTSSDYYILTVTQKVDQTHVKAAMIQVKIKSMNDYLAQYQAQKKVKEYIKLNTVSTVDQSL